ncbi:hypothetical protein NCG89_03165 [Spongiibacter taiwanensis]|uniref:hypothetical protein n=1 Tax=Spongiibacter taiwanensis TaxID=1748242 RepID=UPI0020361C32|nr:hypothetical protein [Spongiibacter taiwanensis]USA43791.1 hypothetical protein NCG89_03165 [Spongiibacter taiwanensis]
MSSPSKVVFCFTLIFSACLSFAGDKYTDLTDSSQSPGFSKRIVRHEDSQFSVMVGMRVHLALTTLMGEPLVYCPATWWLDEIYDHSSGEASVHKFPVDLLPASVQRDLDFYSPKLIFKLKSGYLLACDPGVMSEAASEAPSFTVPASPAWGKLLFSREGDKSSFLPAERAQSILRDLFESQQHSAHVVSEVWIADESKINLWSLARFRAQNAMNALSRQREQSTDPQRISELDRAIGDQAGRFRAAFNKSMSMPGRFARQRGLKTTPCQQQAAKALTTLAEAAEIGRRMQRCIPNAPKAATAKSVPDLRLQTAELEQVGEIQISGDLRYVKSMSSGVVLQKYDDLYFHRRDGDLRQLDGQLAKRTLANYANVIERDNGSFLTYLQGTQLAHYGKSGRRLAALALHTQNATVMRSKSREGSSLIELAPGPDGSVLAVYLSTTNQRDDHRLEVDQWRGGELVSLVSRPLGATLYWPQLTVNTTGPGGYCWLQAELSYTSADEKVVQHQFCLRHQGDRYQLDSVDLATRTAIEEANQKQRNLFAQRAERLQYPEWLEEEHFAHQAGVYHYSARESKGLSDGENDTGWIYLRSPSGAYLLPKSFGVRERLRAVDADGKCLATGQGKIFRFYCVK